MTENAADMHDRADVVALGRQLRDRRRALGLTQEELADLAEVSLRFVHQVEHGKPGSRLDKVLAVVRVLGLRLELLP